MAANNFAEMTRSLRLWVPQLPIPLAEQLIRDRYRLILERRNWSALRAEGEFILNASKSSGTVNVTNNSDAVVGVLTAFAPSDVGRQFKAGAGSPVYTIATVTDPFHLTLDRVWGGDTSALAPVSYTIFDGYVTAPADFMRFIVVTDPRMGWRLRFWITQEELNSWDPQRNFFGQPYCLVDRRFNTTGAQFEAWPYASSARNLPYYYIKRGDDLVDDDDIPIWPIRSDAIVSGALADLCRWPGTQDYPNPLFPRMDVMKSFREEFEDKMLDIERQDESIYMTWLQTLPSINYPAAQMGANYVFSHAV